MTKIGVLRWHDQTVADETKWEPFETTSEEREQRNVLLDGVPTWIFDSVVLWLVKRFRGGKDYVDGDLCRTIQARLEIDLQIGRGDYISSSNMEVVLAGLSDLDLLRVVDLFISVVDVESESSQKMAGLLRLGRSKWTVGQRDGTPGLVEVVPAGVQDAAERAIASGGTPGMLLRRAWENLHALEPSAPTAYLNAVRAVEAIGGTIVTPRDAEPTLGKIRSVMRDQGTWGLPLATKEHTPTQLPLDIIRALWDGHSDRHGSEKFEDVTMDQARVAVMLAVTLVGMFHDGLISRPNDL